MCFFSSTATTQAINTYDANGNPCTISSSTNCGAYVGFGAVGGSPTITSTGSSFISSSPCQSPSSYCKFYPISYNNGTFSIYSSTNNIAVSVTTPTQLYLNGPSGGIKMNVSGNSIALDQQIPMINNGISNNNIINVDDSLFNNSALEIVGPIQNNTKTGMIAVSLTGSTSTSNTSTSNTTGTTGNTNNTTGNTSATPSTQQQTPQRAKKICVMRMKLFNVVP